MKPMTYSRCHERFTSGLSLIVDAMNTENTREKDAREQTGSETCHCGHPYSRHRVSAYGSTCAVPCEGRKDYGGGVEDCYCVRSMAFADVPAEVRPFPGQRPHPQLAAIGMIAGIC